jgi:DNA-directed RNA polymerase specialized sigma24 family protein
MTARSKRALERSLAPYDNATDVAVDPVVLAKVEHAMRRVPRRQREILLAIRLDNMGYPEIADRTGLTVAQVERLFAEALINFTRNLDDPGRHWWRRWLR